MAIQAVQLRKGMVIEADGELLRVHDFQHVTPGKGRAIVQTRLRVRVAKHRHGQLPDGFEEKLEAIDDLSRLYEILEQVSDVSSLEELGLTP